MKMKRKESGQEIFGGEKVRIYEPNMEKNKRTTAYEQY